MDRTVTNCGYNFGYNSEVMFPVTNVPDATMNQIAYHKYWPVLEALTDCTNITPVMNATDIHWQIQGALLAPALMGSNSFIFASVFTEKHVHRRLAPPHGSAPPQWEILDPPLISVK